MDFNQDSKKFKPCDFNQSFSYPFTLTANFHPYGDAPEWFSVWRCKEKKILLTAPCADTAPYQVHGILSAFGSSITPCPALLWFLQFGKRGQVVVQNPNIDIPWASFDAVFGDGITVPKESPWNTVWLSPVHLYPVHHQLSSTTSPPTPTHHDATLSHYPGSSFPPCSVVRSLDAAKIYGQSRSWCFQLTETERTRVLAKHPRLNLDDVTLDTFFPTAGYFCWPLVYLSNKQSSEISLLGGMENEISANSCTDGPTPNKNSRLEGTRPPKESLW